MESNRNFINENIVNISLMAGSLIANGKIHVEDHAELTDHIVTLAESFEESHGDIDYNAEAEKDKPSPDYVEDITAFAEKALLEAYPPKEVKWNFAETALGKFCLEETAYRLRESYNLDPDTLGSEFVSTLAEKLFDVCIDGEAVEMCIDDFLKEHGISVNQEYCNEGLSDEKTSKSDVNPVKPSLNQQIQSAASQTGKSSKADTSPLVQMPGTQDPDRGKKHRDDGR